jgi:hypothetical protein
MQPHVLLGRQHVVAPMKQRQGCPPQLAVPPLELPVAPELELLPPELEPPPVPHAPELQVWPTSVQFWHAAPGFPQAMSSLPDWQAPVVSQQPEQLPPGAHEPWPVPPPASSPPPPPELELPHAMRIAPKPSRKPTRMVSSAFVAAARLHGECRKRVAPASGGYAKGGPRKAGIFAPLAGRQAPACSPSTPYGSPSDR